MFFFGVRCLVVLGMLSIYCSKALGRPINERTSITCHIEDLGSKNTLNLRFSGEVFGAYGNSNVGYTNTQVELQRQQKEIFRPILKNGYMFSWKQLKSPVYAILYSTDRSSKATRYIDAAFIVWPGDSISVSEKNGILQFSGKRSNVYNCAYLIDQQERVSNILHEPATPSGLPLWYRSADSIGVACLNILDQWKNRISNDDYWLLKGDVISYFQYLKVHFLYWRGALNGDSTNAFYPYLKGYISPFWNDSLDTELRGKQILRHSLRYLDFLVGQYKFDSCFLEHREFVLDDCYRYFIRNYTGHTREWIVYELVSQNFSHAGEDVSYCVRDAMNKEYITDPSIRAFFEKLVHNSLPGSVAYNFSLNSLNGKNVHLSDFKGKILLLDFWYVGCGACARLHPYLDSIRDLFSENDFVLISICIDYVGDGELRWREAVKSGRYTSDANVNLFAPGGKSGDPFIAKQYDIKGCPTMILVDANGVVCKQPVDPRNDLGHSMVSVVNALIQKSHS